MAQLTSRKLPALEIPPPFEFVTLPNAMDKPTRVLLLPAVIVKIRTRPPPLMEMKFVPGPRIIVFAVIAGRSLDRKIVPLTFENRIVPPSAAFTSKIACRNEPGPVSSVFVTWMVSAAGSGTARLRIAPSIAARNLGELARIAVLFIVR
jgi:hypothetical protein